MLIAGSPQTPALGAAISAAVTAGTASGRLRQLDRRAGPDDDAQGEAVHTRPAGARAVYDELYSIYRELHDTFGGVPGATADLGDAHEAAAGDQGAGMRDEHTSSFAARRSRRTWSWPRAGSSWGRSATCRPPIAAAGVFAIKPSGVAYETLSPDRHRRPLTRDRRGDRQFAAPVIRHADPPGALSRVRLRRHRPHALRVRHDVRAGADADPLHGHDARGLLPRRHSRHPSDAARRGGAGLREKHRPGDRGDVLPAVFRRPTSRRCSSRTMARSPGVTDAARAIEHARVLEYLARLEWRAQDAWRRTHPHPTSSWSTSTTFASTGRRPTTDRSERRWSGRDAVLWDLDGTLVDSGDYHWRAWRDTMRWRRFELSYEQLPRQLRPEERSHPDGWLGDDTPDERIRRDRRREGSALSGVRAPRRPDTAARRGSRGSERLRREGWRQAIASSAPRANVGRDARSRRHRGATSTPIVSAEDVTRRQARPRRYSLRRPSDSAFRPSAASLWKTPPPGSKPPGGPACGAIGVSTSARACRRMSSSGRWRTCQTMRSTRLVSAAERLLPLRAQRWTLSRRALSGSDRRPLRPLLHRSI